MIHHSRLYTVVTNSPRFDRQLVIEEYWRGVGGGSFLPGTSRAADRFTRASFLLSGTCARPWMMNCCYMYMLIDARGSVGCRAFCSFLLSALPREKVARFITAVPGESFHQQAFAGVVGLLRSVSVPLDDGSPENATSTSTLWRTIIDSTKPGVVYTFDGGTFPNLFSLALEDFDFRPGARVKVY